MRLVIVQNILRDYNHWMFRDLAAVTGFEVVTVFGESPAANRKFASMATPTIPHRRLPTRQLVVKDALLSRMTGLRRTLSELKPDVVMVEGESNFINNEAVRAYSRATGTPYLWWSLGKLPNAPTWNPRRRLVHWLAVGRQLREAGAIVAYSSAAAAYYREIGIPAEKIFVAVNVLSDLHWAPIVERSRAGVAATRARLGLDGKISLLIAGTLIKEKGGDEFLRFFELAQAAPDLPPVVGVVMGEGPERAALEARAKELGLPVTFTGWLDGEAASEVIHACDATVSIGLGGLNLSHALLHGRAIITGPADGTERDLVADGENGYLMPEATAEELLAALRRHLASGRGFDELGAASARRHQDHLNITTWATTIARAAAYARKGAPHERTPA